MEVLLLANDGSSRRPTAIEQYRFTALAHVKNNATFGPLGSGNKTQTGSGRHRSLCVKEPMDCPPPRTAPQICGHPGCNSYSDAANESGIQQNYREHLVAKESHNRGKRSFVWDSEGRPRLSQSACAFLGQR